jgi:Cof subfamily protein (haloacid dehalogenase superfamily)
MDIQAIVTDLDGTLLNSYSKISMFNQRVLQAAIDSGIYLILATGRRLYSTAKFALHFNGEVGAIANNGQLIAIYPEGFRLKEYYIENETVYKIIKYATELGNTPLLHTDQHENEIDFIVDLENSSNLIKQYTMENIDRCKVIKDIQMTDLKKITVCCFFSDEIGILQNLSFDIHQIIDIEKYRTIISTIPNVSHCMEIVNRNTSKWNAIIELLEYKKLSPDQVITFGDQENDIEMIQNAKIGVSVKNASDNIKKASNYISKYTNEEDAVGKTLIELGIVKI